jgi:hypothetical protein
VWIGRYFYFFFYKSIPNATLPTLYDTKIQENILQYYKCYNTELLQYYDITMLQHYYKDIEQDRTIPQRVCSGTSPLQPTQDQYIDKTILVNVMRTLVLKISVCESESALIFVQSAM